MMDWKETLGKIAPTVAAALGGPLAGEAVSAIGGLFGITSAKTADIQNVIEEGQLTADQVYQLRQLEAKYKDNEQERGFRYAELAYHDRDSARRNNVAGGIQGKLFVLSLLLLSVTLGAEGWVLFKGYPTGIPDVVIGRILGLFDAVAMMVLAYYYGTSSGSAQKTEILAAK